LFKVFKISKKIYFFLIANMIFQKNHSGLQYIGTFAALKLNPLQTAQKSMKSF